MLYNFIIYFLLFLTYSIMGWIMEVSLGLIRNGKFVNRGFLIGPYCPIYGCGVLLLTFLLEKYTNDIVATFIFSILICGTLEYFTSFIMEKIFHARWWDYSQRKFNINGRICLETLIPFGIMGCSIIYFANPFILGILYKIPELWIYIISLPIFIWFVVDNIISFKIILNLKEISQNFKDNTEEISAKVRKIISNKSVLHRRLVNAYPLIQGKVRFKEWIIKGKEKVNKILNEKL